MSEEPAKYCVSKVTIQLAGNKREPSKKLSTSRASPSPQHKASKSNSFSSSSSPQRKASNNSFFASEQNNSRDSLSYSVLSQVAKRPVEGTPRTSTPELRTSVSPRDGQKNVSSMYRGDILSGMEKTKKLFYDSSATNNVDSTHDLNQESISRPPLEFITQYSHRDEFSKKHWYFDIVQRLEDLSWSYQTLETEYSFLEKLMDEQKEDLKKAKSWNKHLKNQNTTSRANKVY